MHRVEHVLGARTAAAGRGENELPADVLGNADQELMIDRPRIEGARELDAAL